MKSFLSLLLGFFVITFSNYALSHSGGTDRYGCHAGSRPYHCHSTSSGSSGSSGSSSSSSSSSNGSYSQKAWDINLGYQYHITDTELIPFTGLSYGKSDQYKDPTLGFNVGLKLQKGWYASYVSTSKSIQLGYGFLHMSRSSDFIGIGIRLPFDKAYNSNQSSSYISGTSFILE